MARSRFSSSVTRDTIILWVFLVIVAVMGGGSRANIQSLVFLRPVACLVLGYGLYRLTSDDIRAYRWLLLLFGAAIVLVAVQLVPLPPNWWQAMSGRDVAARIDRVAGLGEIWRPLSLVPDETWNALFSLAVPSAALLLSLRQSSDERRLTMYVLLAIGLVSGLLGLLQIAGADDSPLYLYQNTDRGSSVGLFANRNHQGMFLACLFPMIAVAAVGRTKTREASRFRHVAAWAALVVLIPLILITGSRSGLLLGLFGLLVAAAIVLRGRPAGARIETRRMAIYAGGIVALIAIVAVTALSTRAIALERLFASGGESDLRLAIWQASVEMTRTYFPWGAGYGTFADIFKIDEPREMLSYRYRNHVHNDPIEIVMTGGLPGLLLLVGGVILFLGGVYQSLRQDADRDTMLLRWLGAAMLFMLALGSLVDYPLRVPLLSCFATCAAVWLGLRRGRGSDMRADGRGTDVPNGGRRRGGTR